MSICMDDLKLDANYSQRMNSLPTETRDAIQNFLKHGRPSKMSEEMLPKLLIMSAQGFSQSEISSRLGISKATLLRWVARDLVKGGSNGVKDSENRTLQDRFRDTYAYGRTLAQAHFDKIANNQLVNPDKAFNDRLHIHTYKLRFCQGSDAPVLPNIAGLEKAIEDGDHDGMTKSVLLAASQGDICIDSLDSAVNTIKRSADMSLYEQLQERLEKLEEN